MIKKEEVMMGKTVRQELTLLQFIQSFFGAQAVEEVKSIQAYTEEHRLYRKKRVAEERATRWGPIRPVREKSRR